jgi:hypothetical protein
MPVWLDLYCFSILISGDISLRVLQIGSLETFNGEPKALRNGGCHSAPVLAQLLHRLS